jgi:hypothetical protein
MPDVPRILVSMQTVAPDTLYLLDRADSVTAEVSSLRAELKILPGKCSRTLHAMATNIAVSDSIEKREPPMLIGQRPTARSIAQAAAATGNRKIPCRLAF